MNIKMTTRDEADVIIVSIAGKLTLGEGTSALREKARRLSKSGVSRIVLNMAGVTYIDSSGLGELVAAQTTVRAAGGEMKLLNLSKHAHDLLKVTKLCTVFETFEDEGSAIRSYPASPVGVPPVWAKFYERYYSTMHG